MPQTVATSSVGPSRFRPGSTTSRQEKEAGAQAIEVSSTTATVDVFVEDVTRCRTVHEARQYVVKTTEESLSSDGKSAQWWLGGLGAISAVAGGVALAAPCNQRIEGPVQAGRPCTDDELSERNAIGYAFMGLGAALLVNVAINGLRVAGTTEEEVPAAPAVRMGEWKECARSPAAGVPVTFKSPDGWVVRQTTTDQDGRATLELEDVAPRPEFAEDALVRVYVKDEEVGDARLKNAALLRASEAARTEMLAEAARAAERSRLEAERAEELERQRRMETERQEKAELARRKNVVLQFAKAISVRKDYFRASHVKECANRVGEPVSCTSAAAFKVTLQTELVDVRVRVENSSDTPIGCVLGTGSFVCDEGAVPPGSAALLECHAGPERSAGLSELDAAIADLFISLSGMSVEGWNVLCVRDAGGDEVGRVQSLNGAPAAFLLGPTGREVLRCEKGASWRCAEP